MRLLCTRTRRRCCWLYLRSKGFIQSVIIEATFSSDSGQSISISRMSTSTISVQLVLRATASGGRGLAVFDQPVGGVVDVLGALLRLAGVGQALLADSVRAVHGQCVCKGPRRGNERHEDRPHLNEPAPDSVSWCRDRSGRRGTEWIRLQKGLCGEESGRWTQRGQHIASAERILPIANYYRCRSSALSSSSTFILGVTDAKFPSKSARISSSPKDSSILETNSKPLGP